MYLEMDSKGRVLIPVAWRRELGLHGRLHAETKDSAVVLRSPAENNFWIKYAGFIGKKHKIGRMSAQEFDDEVEKAMLEEAARKFK
ncbi:MAG: hypothetical protein V1708_03595 [Candidatus Micrarchaeota archaeon]